MMKKVLLIIAAFLSLGNLLKAQEESSLIELDGGNLTSREFYKRFELTPRIRTTTDLDSQKVQFMLSLASEKLWAEEARSRNLDTSFAYREYLKNLEKLLVRDELFNREVIDRVEIAEQELNDALNKRKETLRLKFLLSRSEKEIDNLYSELKEGNSFDSILAGRPEASEQKEPVTVKFGQMQKKLEDLVYNLNPGEFTKPLNTPAGWVIYYLVNKKTETFDDRGKIVREVRRTLENREKKRLMENYMSSFLKDKRVNTDGELFNLLADEIADKLSNKFAGTEHEMYFLYENDFRQIENKITTNKLNQDFVKFEESPVSLRQFIHYLAFNNFKTDALSSETISNQLNGIVREFIRMEFLSREGYNRGYEELPEIKNELRMWSDNYLAQMLKNSYNDSAKVTPAQIDKYIAENMDSAFTRKFAQVGKLTVRNLEDIDKIFNLLDNGKSFDETAMLYDPEYQQPELKPLYEYGSLAEIIEKMDEGEVYGPIRKENGYLIIKNFETEEKSIGEGLTDTLRIEQAKEKLYYKKLSSILEQHTIELAEQYNLEVNPELLEKIRVTEIPSMVYRYYGFGGQTTAAPFTNLFYEWYLDWKAGKDFSL